MFTAVHNAVKCNQMQYVFDETAPVSLQELAMIISPTKTIIFSPICHITSHIYMLYPKQLNAYIPWESNPRFRHWVSPEILLWKGLWLIVWKPFTDANFEGKKTTQKHNLGIFGLLIVSLLWPGMLWEVKSCILFRTESMWTGMQSYSTHVPSNCPPLTHVSGNRAYNMNRILNLVKREIKL